MTENYPNSKLSPHQVEMIRHEYQSGQFTQRQIAERFNITQPAVWQIVNGRAWRKKTIFRIEHNESWQRLAIAMIFLIIGIFISFAVWDNLLYQPLRDSLFWIKQYQPPPRIREIQRLSSILRIPAGMAGELIAVEDKLRYAPGIMFKVAYRESGFNPKAIGSAGELGLCQIFLKTAQDYIPHLTKEDLLDYRVNIRVAAKHLKPLIEKYGLNLGLIYYNCGESKGLRIGHIWIKRLDSDAQLVLHPKGIRTLLEKGD